MPCLYVIAVGVFADDFVTAAPGRGVHTDGLVLVAEGRSTVILSYRQIAKAVAFWPSATVSWPKAVALDCLAVVRWPKAVARSSKAWVACPKAVELLPLALLRSRSH